MPRWPLEYRIKSFKMRSRKISQMRDCCLELSNRFEIWQVSRLPNFKAIWAFRPWRHGLWDEKSVTVYYVTLFSCFLTCMTIAISVIDKILSQRMTGRVNASFSSAIICPHYEKLLHSIYGTWASQFDCLFIHMSANMVLWPLYISLAGLLS